MIGAIQLCLAFGMAGRFGRLVPESVLAGFTTGVGLKLLDGQIPELLGFDYKVSELAQMMHKPLWLHHVVWLAVVCGMMVALFVVGMARFRRFPAALIGVIVATFVAVYLGWNIERVGEIPSSLPMPKLPMPPWSRQWPVSSHRCCCSWGGRRPVRCCSAANPWASCAAKPTGWRESPAS